MRHNKKFNHLGRTADHRHAMLANLAISLIMHKRITTTVAKAKALKKYVEPLITRSKEDTTNSRRVVFSYLQNKEALNVNMKNAESQMHDGGLLEYSRLEKMTIQAWSPFQYGFFKGTFVDHADFPELNAKLAELGETYGLSKTGVAAAWILRHPANMQLIAGTMNTNRLTHICKAADVNLTRSEWYEIYRAAGHCLP